MDIIFYIPASVKSLKNYVTGSRKALNDRVHLFFLTARGNSGIHESFLIWDSFLAKNRILGLIFLLGTFLFFFLSFLFELRPGWLLPLPSFFHRRCLDTDTQTIPLNVLACSDNTKEVCTPSSFDFWQIFPLCLYDFFLFSNYWLRY